MGLSKGLFSETYFTPNSINRDAMSRMFTGVSEQVKRVGREALSNGWRFYAVDQTRGRCYYKHKVITIPAWVINQTNNKSKQIGYKDWYIAHELAHTFARGDNHGPLFMAQLKRICPKEYVHYEIEYKPRNANSAGIRNPDDDEFDLGF
jgi:hypothetical protein